MEGRVMKSTGSWHEVLVNDGTRYNCRLQGKLRLEGIKESNPVAIGDYVELLVDKGDASITDIRPRINHILRQSVKRTGHTNVLAANVDQALLIATLTYPRTSPGFIDRFFVSAEAFRIPQILVFNKKDLLNKDELHEVEELKKVYENVGVKTLVVSALGGDLSTLSALLTGKTTLVAGHSGVGKSTLLNRISPTIQQTIGELSDFNEKGKHTTTFAEMFSIGNQTFIIDTPGVKEWGLVEMNQQEISDYFPEMRGLRSECKFGSKCLHLTEPKCAVRLAVEEGKIALSRYNSYVRMVMGEDTRK
ncbi:MAG TPA: ribosome small subunit-dependent GTPase A [Cyclobacteriaceae bacterium]|nr:ribosome small subunit-dependent GTPase A [Cyclobacteriaceae bacterium]